MNKFHALIISLSTLSIANAQEITKPSNEIPIYQTKDEALKASGLDVYTNKYNDNVIEKAISDISTIKTQLGNTFAGDWIDYDENNQAHHFIAITRWTPNARALTKVKDKKIVFVSHSLEYLEKTRDKIIQNFLKPSYSPLREMIYGGEINTKSNSITIRAQKENFEILKKAFIEAGIDISVIEFYDQRSNFKLFGTIDAGTPITFSTASNPVGSFRCTSGFNTVIDIYPLAITAGHCASYNPSWQTVYLDNGSIFAAQIGEKVGGVLANDFSTGMDVAIYANANFVHNMTFYLNKGSGQLKGVVKPWIDLTSAPTNSTTCAYGNMSGWRCGQIKSTTAFQNINGIIFHHVVSYICGAPGDSGGPVVTASNQAAGLYIGAEGSNLTYGNCGPVFGGAPATSVIQPLTPIMRKYPTMSIRTG